MHPTQRPVRRQGIVHGRRTVATHRSHTYGLIVSVVTGTLAAVGFLAVSGVTIAVLIGSLPAADGAPPSGGPGAAASVATLRPTATLGPTASPSSTGSLAPTATVTSTASPASSPSLPAVTPSPLASSPSLPAVTPSPPASSDQPPPIARGDGAVTFGRLLDPGSLRISDADTVFRLAEEIAWSADLGQPAGALPLRLEIERIAPRPPMTVTSELVPVRDPGSRVVAREVRLEELISDPGDYEVRYLRGTQLLAAGVMRILP